MERPASLPEHPYYTDYSYSPGEILLKEFVLPTNGAELASQLAECRIPTPQTLQRIQRSRGQPPLMSPQQSPKPFPPSRLKSELLDPARYEDGLARIRNLDLSHPADFGSSLDSLCDRLFAHCVGADGDLDRLVAAFGLVCRLCERPEELQRLVCLAELAAGQLDWQSEVFHAVVSCCGVPCQRLEGIKKGANYATGSRCQVGGSWFACFVSGEWRHVDAIWGSTGLPGAADANESEAAMVASAVPERNDFFFLTDPAKLAFSHHPLWPPGADWQLLARPLSLAEFHRLPAYFEGNRTAMGVCLLEPVSCPLCVIPCSGGVADLLLAEGSQHERYRYTLQAIQRSGTSSNAVPAGAVSKPIRLQGGQIRLKFLAPRAGRYELRVGVQRGDPSPSLAEHFATYVAHCPAAAPEPAAFPPGQLAEFGLTEEAEREGVRLAGCQGEAALSAEFEAEDGEAAWRLTCPNPLGDDLDAPLPCHVTFGEGDNQTEPSELHRHLLQWSGQAGRLRGFRFLAPYSGWFAVTVWRDSARQKPLAELLVVAHSAAAGARLGLPEAGLLLGWPSNNTQAEDPQRRGGNRRRRLPAEDIQLTSPGLPGGGWEPCLSLRHETELTLSFRTQGRYVAGAVLQRLRAGGLLAEPLAGFALVNGAPEGFQVHVRFPQPGNYLLDIRVRPRSDKADSVLTSSTSEAEQPLCLLLLRSLCTAAPVAAAPSFPRVLDAEAASDFQLLEPLQRRLTVSDSQPRPVIRLASLEPSTSGRNRQQVVALIGDDSPPRRLAFRQDEAGLSFSLELGDNLSISGSRPRSLTVASASATEDSGSTDVVPLLAFDLLPGERPNGANTDAGSSEERGDAARRRVSLELARSESRRRWERENWRRAAEAGLQPLAWDAQQWERRTAEALAQQRAEREAEMERQNRLLEEKRLQDKLLSLVEAAFPNVLNGAELVRAAQSEDSTLPSQSTEQALDALVEQRRLFPRQVPGGTAYLLQEERPAESAAIDKAASSERWGMGRLVGFNRANFADLQLLRQARPTVAMVTRLMCEKRALDAVTLDKESFVQFETRGGGRDSHVYTLGKIGRRRVVSTKLPAVVGSPDGLQARVACGNVVTRLLGVFQDVEHILLVGVGGSAAAACQLGDVFVGDAAGGDYVEPAGVRRWSSSDRRLMTAARAAAKTVDAASEDVADWTANLESLAAEAPAFARPPRTSATTPRVAFGVVSCGAQPVPVGADHSDFVGADAGFDEVLESALGSRCHSFLLVRGCADFHTGEQGLLWQPFAALAAACFAEAIVKQLPDS